MVCYRQFRVDNPKFLSKLNPNEDKDKTLQMDEVLHYTEDRKKLFLLSTELNKELTLTVLDL